MPVSDATYERLALEDDDTKWELHCGRLVEKPPMTAQHADLIDKLYRRFAAQLPEDEYGIRADNGRLRNAVGTYYIPDLCVVPRTSVERLMRDLPNALEVYNEPLPLVVEIWSPSTGQYDVDTKIPDYRRRGDTEIWRLHARDRTLTVWHRQSDGRYSEATYTGGIVWSMALPGLSIDLDELFR